MNTEPEVTDVSDVGEVAYRDPYAYNDDVFASIVGYTPDGEPFGLKWEDLGIDPGLPYEEKARLYYEINGEAVSVSTLSDLFM